MRAPAAPAADEDDFTLRRYSIPEAEPLIAGETDPYRLLLWREADERKGIRAAVEARVDELISAATAEGGEGEGEEPPRAPQEGADGSAGTLESEAAPESEGEPQGRRARTRHRDTLDGA